MYKCSFCKREQSGRLSKGFCHQCYVYFYVYGFSIWAKSEYGSISRVKDKNSNQYGQIICHECGKAFVKLQQHIYYTHGMSKNEYCDKWGLDHKIRLTGDEYNKKMSDYAYTYKMDEQLNRTGKGTRFKVGHNRNYKRSYQTQQRLKNSFKDWRCSDV